MRDRPARKGVGCAIGMFEAGRITPPLTMRDGQAILQQPPGGPEVSAVTKPSAIMRSGSGWLARRDVSKQAPARQAAATLEAKRHWIKTWRILRKLRCCPWRAGRLSKAIHVLQIREA